MKIQSSNEWDSLKAVLLGSVSGFVPGISSNLAKSEIEFEEAISTAAKAFPEWYISEVEEDLSLFEKTLVEFGTKVLRPEWSEKSPKFQTPNWQGVGYDLYNVRDLQIVFANKLVSSATSNRFRLFEQYAIQTIIYDHFF
jgi:hypothetical protein